jgi:hypothetical protein
VQLLRVFADFLAEALREDARLVSGMAGTGG